MCFTVLVEQAQQGDADAVEELNRRFRDMAVSTALRLCKDPAIAEDIAQEALLESHLRLDRRRVPAAYPKQLRFLVFKHFDRWKRKNDESGLPVNDDLAVGGAHVGDIEVFDRATAIDEALIARELAQEIKAILDTMPENKREIVTLYYWYRFTQPEIAILLEIEEHTIRNATRDGRNLLRRELTARFPEDQILEYLESFRDA